MRRPKKTVTINLADYLSAGTYNVKVKSKGTDIRDSADSNSVECVVSGSLSDLTGTKWEINSTTCSAGYGEFDITGTYGDPVESSIGFIKIGYVMIFHGQQSLRGGGGLEPKPFYYAPNDDNILINSNPTYLSVGDIIEITGGTDTTNPDLIAWLEANAVQIVQGGGNND